eukprot:jgi/Psemu1/70507/estExt_Genemark1.C_23850001
MSRRSNLNANANANANATMTNTTIAIAALGGFLLFVNTQMPKHTFRNLIYQAATTSSYNASSPPRLDYYYYNNYNADFQEYFTESAGAQKTILQSPALSSIFPVPPVSLVENNGSSGSSGGGGSDNITHRDATGDGKGGRTTKIEISATHTISNTSRLTAPVSSTEQAAEQHEATSNTTTSNATTPDLQRTAPPLLRSAKERTPLIPIHSNSNSTSTSRTSSPQTTDANNNADTNNNYWTNATKMDDGNLLMEFFHGHNTIFDSSSPSSSSSSSGSRNKDGMSACLIQLEDTIRLAEWIPYHYATLPLTGLVIALDPNNSQRAIRRVLDLVDLWKDKIEISLWPDYVLPPERRFRSKQSYVRERQVYFANRCLSYHKAKNRSWTLLTDNDEYLLFNYKHDDEVVTYDHPSAEKRRVRRRIDSDRKKYMALRDHLPPPQLPTTESESESESESVAITILDYIRRENDKIDHTVKHSDFLPKCVRLPGIHYGGTLGVTNATAVWGTGNDGGGNSNDISNDNDNDNNRTSRAWPLGSAIDRSVLSTYREVQHAKRKSTFSKVMIDVRRAKASDLVWTSSNHARTIHNPSKAVCGSNGASDSGADYFSSLFRLNHYLGGPEAFLERRTDYRSDRSLATYEKKLSKISGGATATATATATAKEGSSWDTDIGSWIHVLVRSVGVEAAAELLAPLQEYFRAAAYENQHEHEHEPQAT